MNNIFNELSKNDTLSSKNEIYMNRRGSYINFKELIEQ